jgi:hypothetical protein
VGGVGSWRLAATVRVQSAFLWRWNWRTGSQGRGFQLKAHRGRCDFWMPPHSLRNHARAVGIVEATLVSKNVADICGTDTPPGFLVGVIARDSQTL